jgi:hypothetical protein
MHTRHLLKTVAAVVLLSQSSAWALGGRGRFTHRGTTELSGNVGFSVASGGLVTFSLQPNVGYFVAKGVELSLSPGLTLTAGDIDTYALFLLAGASYNFDLSSDAYPFFGLVGGLMRGAVASRGPVTFATPGGGAALGVVGFEAGVKITLGHAALLRPQIQFLAIPALDDSAINVAAQMGAGIYF